MPLLSIEEFFEKKLGVKYVDRYKLIPGDKEGERFSVNKTQEEIYAEEAHWFEKKKEAFGEEAALNWGVSVGTFEETLRFGSIHRKERDLVSFFKKQVGSGRSTPVVDHKFRLVFMVSFGHHRTVMANLYNLHNPSSEFPSIIRSADSYIQEGYGYFMSGVDRAITVNTKTYRADKSDQGVFEAYRVDDLAEIM